MYEVFTKIDLNKMKIDHAILMERVKINDIVEKIKLKVLESAKTSDLKYYHWLPNAFDKNYLLPPDPPSKLMLLEICKKLQLIFMDSDIRVLENTIFISWF
jgi:hypothetical protein